MPGAVEVELGEFRLIPGPKGDPGERGPRGYGISSAVLNPDYTLTLNFENGDTYTTPPIRGEDGAGVADVEVVRGDYDVAPYDTLKITLTDERVFELRLYNAAAESARSAGESAERAEDAARSAQEYSLNAPEIRGGTWWVWNAERREYADTGYAAKGSQGEAGSDYHVNGFADNVEDLAAKCPDPASGEAWGVGTGQPYHMYVYDGVGRRWVDVGEFTVSESEEMTPEEVQILWELTPEDGSALATVEHEKLSGRGKEKQHPIEAISGLDEIGHDEVDKLFDEI